MCNTVTNKQTLTFFVTYPSPSLSMSLNSLSALVCSPMNSSYDILPSVSRSLLSSSLAASSLMINMSRALSQYLSDYVVLRIPASRMTLVHCSLLSRPSPSLVRLTAFWNCLLISSFFLSSFFLLFIKNQLILNLVSPYLFSTRVNYVFPFPCLHSMSARSVSGSGPGDEAMGVLWRLISEDGSGGHWPAPGGCHTEMEDRTQWRPHTSPAHGTR